MIADVNKVLVVVKADRTLDEFPVIIAAIIGCVALTGRGDHGRTRRIVINLTLRDAARARRK